MKGGKRSGAGRPKGKPTKATLERQAVLRAVNQRIMAKADALFNAQLMLAVGSMRVFRVDEVEGENGKTKREHVHVTDPDEIKALLDEHDGLNGVVEGVYYYFTDISPDNKAIEAMMNRAFGKPVESLKAEVDTRDVTNHSHEERADRILKLVKSTRAA